MALILVLLAIPTFYVIKTVQNRRIRAAALALATEFERNHHQDQAIRHLRHYLGTQPHDLAALTLQARLLAETARGEQILEAVDLNEQLLRRLPEGPDRQAARRRLVDLTVRIAEGQRSRSRIAAELGAKQGSRYTAAVVIAKQLFGPDRTSVPADHRRFAMALEGLIAPGTPDVQNKAIAEFKEALKGDPGDVIAAERLARLYDERLHDPVRARGVLDDLAKASPRSVAVFEARYRYYMGRRDLKQAAAEIDRAKAIEPENLAIRLMACHLALRMRDTVKAKSELDALPPALQENYFVRVERGKIALYEERPDEAIDDWRNSLSIAGGTDAELTWQLANALLNLGQLAEASPLIERYRQISGENGEPLHVLLQAQMDLRLGRPARAKFNLERIQNRISDPWQQLRLFMTLGQAHEQLWDEEQAMEAYRRASQADPIAAEPRIAIVKLLLNRKPEDARAEIERGLKSTPEEPALLNALAELHLRRQAQLPVERRSWTEFDETLKKASKGAPASTTLASLQATRLAMEGKLPAMVLTLKQAVDRSPKNTSIAIGYADSLARIGQLDEALHVLERAARPEAAGDKAALRSARANLLLLLGRGREAREILVRDIDHLSHLERPLVWRALYRLEASQGNMDAARNAILECARLLPVDPQPRLDLLALAISSGDEALVHSTVEELRAKNEEEGTHEKDASEDLIWRICRVQELLWATRFSPSPTGPTDPKLEEARQILEKILFDAPKMPLAHLLRGELMERLNKTDEAEIDYQFALRGGTGAALPRLINLLTRLGKQEELANLKQSTQASQFDMLSTLASLKLGDSAKAAESLAKMNSEALQTPASQLWRAGMLERIGKREEAETLLKDLARRQPNDLEPQLRLIRLLAAHGNTKEVSATIERIRAAIKTDRPELIEARCRWAASDRLAADKAFEAALKRWPNEVEVCRFAAAYYEETGRRDEARTCLERIFKIDPGDRPVARQLAGLLASSATDLDSWKRAWETLGPEPEEKSEAPEERITRAMVLAAAPDPAHKEEAIARLETLIADIPTNSALAPTARNLLASLLVRAGRPLRASQLAALSATSDTDAAAITLYAETLIQAKKWDEAEIQIDRLATLGPASPQTARLRAHLIQTKATPDQAVAALEKAIADRAKMPDSEVFSREVCSLLDQMGPAAAEATERVARLLSERNPADSWMLGRLRARQGQFVEALRLCRRSVETGTRTDCVSAVRVLIEIAIGQANDTKLASDIDPILKRALTTEPDSIDLLVMLAMFEHARGHYDEEIRLYRQVLRHQPGQVVALNNLAWVLSEVKHQSSEALTFIEDVVQHVGPSAQALDTRGVILFRLGRHEDAIRDLEESNRLSPLAATEFHLASAYQAAGREEEFRKHRDRLKESLKPEQLDACERAAFEILMKP